MTYARMVEVIAKRTGIPKSAVRHVLDTQCDVMRASLSAQSDVHFPHLMKITAAPRKISFPQHEGMDESGGSITKLKTLERVTLRVRPMRRFRKELNQWTSSQS